jgi:hypothetical protein
MLWSCRSRYCSFSHIAPLDLVILLLFSPLYTFHLEHSIISIFYYSLLALPPLIVFCLSFFHRQARLAGRGRCLSPSVAGFTLLNLIKDMSSRLPMADVTCRNVAPLNGHHRSLSLSNLDMAGLDVTLTPDVNRRWVAEDTEQQTPTHAYIQDKVRNSSSSDCSSDGATSVQPVSPRTMYADPRTVTTSSKPHDPSPVGVVDADGFSPDLWVISPEERALMTNSAQFARDRRRRRGAVIFDAPLELHCPPPSSPTSHSVPPSPAPPLVPACSRDSRRDDNIGPASPTVPDVNRAPPRGRLQRSFTPSEREDAGVAIVPGLLRRLARPFSGPWRGPSSPLAHVSLVDAPPAGPLKRLSRIFSRRRRD